MQVSDIIRAAGGASKVAKAIDRHHATVLRWQRVPAEHVRQVARLTKLQPHVIRPDIYDAPAEQVAA
jgi:hypothetical protein